MDSDCKCYPQNRENCADAVWNKCCAQEIACHQLHCTMEVLGKPRAKLKIRTRETFASNDENPIEIKKGTHGRVVRLDTEGDVLVKFFDEFNDESGRHWIFGSEFWKLVDATERVVPMRAVRVSWCLDKCVQDQHCDMGTTLAEKKKKQDIQAACRKACKLDACNGDQECRELLGKYSTCKFNAHKVCRTDEEKTTNEDL